VFLEHFIRYIIKKLYFGNFFMQNLKYLSILFKILLLHRYHESIMR
jgi:hypothetical protein